MEDVDWVDVEVRSTFQIERTMVLAESMGVGCGFKRSGDSKAFIARLTWGEHDREDPPASPLLQVREGLPWGGTLLFRGVQGQ